MMKKLILFLLIGFVSFSAFAQKVDTIKHWVGGVQMLSTNDVIQNLSESKQFSIFVSLIDKAGLTDSIRNMSSVTIIAPDNKAFGNKGEKWLDTVGSPGYTPLLKKFILNYIIQGQLLAKDIKKQADANNGQAVLTTVSGHKLTASINPDRNIVLTDEHGDQGIISKFDVPEKNGILDVLNTVLLP
jgi:uncharacterized surface protein with fasciclin (FAS1) repeats